MDNFSERESWWTRNRQWVIPVAGVGAFLACISCVVTVIIAIFFSAAFTSMISLMMSPITSSDVYRQAMTTTRENTAAVEALGTPIEARFWVNGSISESESSGSAHMAIPVYGPKDSGTLYVDAVRSAGSWELTTLKLVLKDSNDGIDLLLDQKFSSSPDSDDCESMTEPTEQDVKYVLDFAGNAFESDGWERSYTVQPDRVRVTWLNDGEGAVAFLEYLVYGCGYTQADVDKYFSRENFETVIFADYENPQRIATCTDSNGDLTLHEFTAQIQETDYIIRFWIRPDNETRVMDAMIVFPDGSEAALDKYAREIFPQLSSCRQ